MSVPSRVLFRESQLLRATDLQTEQQYLLALAGRHRLAPHTWGIVRGLSVSIQGDALTVQPGLAVDGYGRELVVFRPTRFTFPAQPTTQFIYLYYCERPQGACGPAPNPRFRDSAEIQIAHIPWPIPEGDPDLTSATAAGCLFDSQPWPVLIGIIKARRRGEFHVRTSGCLYTRLHHSLICSPSGTALVRVGAENLGDPYQFRVSLKAAASNLQNRFALDRDGNAIFWGNLILTSSTRGAMLPTQIAGRFLRVRVKPDVVGMVSVKYHFSPATRSPLFITFSASPPTAPNDVLQLEGSAVTVKKAIKSLNTNSRLVNLHYIAAPTYKTPASLGRSHSPVRSPQPALLDDRELPVSFTGADLSFATEQVNTPSSCDCPPSTDNPESLPAGFTFLPGTGAPTPPARDIYRVQLQPKDEPPSDETRIAGGAKKDGDFSRRISISGQSASGLLPLLAFRGNGTLALPGDLSGKGMSSHLLRVIGGGAQLPAVKPDPRDQLFSSLLIMAFTHGVLSLSSSVLTLKVAVAPFLESRQPWNYDLTLENLSTTDALKAKSSSEILWTDKLASPSSLLIIPPNIPAGSSAKLTISHFPEDLPDGASHLLIQVLVVMVLGTAPTAGKVVAPTKPIPIHTSPSAVLSNLTDPISSGSSFEVYLRNASTLDCSVTVASLSPPSHPSQDLLGSAHPLTVRAGQTVQFPIDGRVTVGPAARVKFTLEIAYHWTSGDAPTDRRTLSFHKTVTVT